MKKLLFFLILALLVLSGKSMALGDFGEKSFRHLMEKKWAREVFDLEKEEAISVFGEDGEACFL